jgi:hypothetical protein
MARSREAQLVLDLLIAHAGVAPVKLWGTVAKVYQSWGPPPRPAMPVEEAAAELVEEGVIALAPHPTRDTYLVTLRGAVP